MNLSEWRKEYDKYKLSENAVDSCPFAQFKKWFDEAHREGVRGPEEPGPVEARDRARPRAPAHQDPAYHHPQDPLR